MLRNADLGLYVYSNVIYIPDGYFDKSTIKKRIIIMAYILLLLIYSFLYLKFDRNLRMR